MNRSRWPSDHELRQLLDGSLTADRYAQIEALLDEDDDLRQHLEKIAGGSSWIGRASDSGRHAKVDPSDAALLAAIGGLKAQAGAATQAQDMPRTSMTLSFLSPSEVPGSLGRLNRYEVQELIGCGGFGMVLKAHDPRLNRIVAIKVLNPALANHSAPRKRFVREAQQLATIKHEDVVTIYEIEEEHQPPFIVMEYVAGISLQELIDREGPLPLAKILRIGSQAAEGLAAAHKKGLIHRDVKPANILLENGVQRVKLTDFGLARAVDEASLTQSGIVSGTPQYMAPEQARGETVDYRSDLFSLGSVLYTLCAGRPAFRADSAVAVLKRVCEDAPRPLREVNPEIPDWLEGIVNKLMAKAPNDRFTSSREVADLLDQCLAHIQQPRLIPLPETAARLSSMPVSHAPHAARYNEPVPQVDLVAVRRKVAWPGLGMILAGLINITFLVISLALLDERVENIDFAGAFFSGGLALASVFVMFGGFSLRSLRYSPVVWISSFLSMILGPGLIVGLPSAVWAMILMTREEVAAAFRQLSGENRRDPRSNESIKQLTTAPAIGMMAVAAINFGAIVVLALTAFGGGMRWTMFLGLVVFIVLAPSTFLILMGANAMRQLRQWPLALIAAILCMLIAPGSIIGLFIGIWAIVVLLRRDVRVAFDVSNQSLPPVQVAPPGKPVYAMEGARPRSPAGGLAIATVIMVCLLASICILPVLLVGGFFYSAVSVRPAPNFQPPSAVEYGMSTVPQVQVRLSILCDLQDHTLKLSDLGHVGFLNEEWRSDAYRGERGGRQFSLPASTFRITAHDKQGSQIFSREVRLQIGDDKRIVVVPQVAPKTLSFVPKDGAIDLGDIRDTILAPQGDRFAYVLKDGEVIVSSTATGEEEFRLNEFKPTLAAFSHDGKSMAVVGMKDEETIAAVYNLADRKAPKILKPSGKHTGGKYARFQNVKAMAFSPDGATLLVSSAYNWTKEKEEDSDFRSMIHLFRAADGEELAPLGPQDGTIDQLLFPAKKSDFVAGVSNSEVPRASTLAWWEISGRQTIGRSWQIERYIDRIAISPQGGWIYEARASMNQTRGGADFRDVRAIVTRRSLLGGSDFERGLWETGQKIDLDFRIHEMQVSPDGTLLALAKDLQTIELWQASTPQRLVRLGELTSADYRTPIGFTFTPDSQELVMASGAGEVKRYDVSRWTKAEEEERQTTKPVQKTEVEKPQTGAIDLLPRARTNESTFWGKEDDKLHVKTDDKYRALAFDTELHEEVVAEATFRRISGNGFLIFDVHANKLPVNITLNDGPKEETQTGIGLVDVGPRSADNSRDDLRIENKVPHVFRCVVRKASIICTLDNRIVALYDKSPDSFPRHEFSGRWGLVAGPDSEFWIDEFKITPLDKAGPSVPIHGTWESHDSPDITFLHNELKSNDIIDINGSYRDQPIKGKFDPIARVVWWSFGKDGRQGKARHYLDPTNTRLHGDKRFPDDERFDNDDWQLVRKDDTKLEVGGIDFRGVPAELQKIALLAQTDLQRLREQREAGVVSAEELDEAEARLIDALITCYTAAQRDSEVIKQLEQLLKVRQRHIDRVDQLTKQGVAPPSEASAARKKLLEVEYRLRKARETAIE